MAERASARFRNGLLPVDLPTHTELVRIHWQSNGAVFFGPKPGKPPSNRFDAPGGEYRILYAAAELPGAYVETVLRHPYRIMRRAEADERAATRLQVKRPLKLAKVMDEGLQWHGIHAGEIAVDTYGPSRKLALEFFNAFPDIDGLAYRSRYNNGQVCFALFDRVDPANLEPMARLDFHTAPVIVGELMRMYGAAFDTSPLP